MLLFNRMMRMMSYEKGKLKQQLSVSYTENITIIKT